MSDQPTAYTPATAFSSFNPSAFPSLGTDLDVELENVSTAMDETQARLAEIQRDDGALANDSVGPDQLENSVFAGINTPAAWAAGVAYSVRDSVIDLQAAYSKWYKCIVAHTSATSLATGIAAGYWELILNTDIAAVDADAAAAAASAASTAADVVLTHADVVLTHADVVLTHADVVLTHADVVLTHADAVSTAADVVSAAASAAKLTGTSTTSLTPAVASKTFTTQSGKQFTVGVFVLATSDADPTIYMHGQVTAYSGTTLTVNVTNIGTATTKADWTITVSGTRGATGAAGTPADADETKALAGVVTADISSGTTAMTANRRYRITGAATATLASFTADQWNIVEFGASTGTTQTIGRNSQTIDGVAANDTCTTYGPIVEYFCTGTGVVRSKIIGYLPS
jgi:hypothetical protein